ncbi:hypothetical protein BOTBODRAFT_182841 [Botryobasidium botryosum FD-172 SS1]|uniref:Uncharacterized protein n=1 Tax=Botryobasidium botryosum (strain FD-172 SS1) TaxID=930990 RepID=A0A067N0J5_BOTB1|nr:hypothetical protein BOTBODRAFT_182841 [Botryobasidium botryosum FD-172 SS1]
MHALTILAVSLSIYGAVLSLPTLRGRADPDNTVVINSDTSYCLIVPRNPHTNIGDSEQPGGEQAYCSVQYDTPTGVNGGRVVQLTGCIDPSTLDRLNPDDGGGQYDSSGGDGGLGNPAGSQCVGYNHYVEILEPSANRGCIRCCDDPDDCPLDQDTAGCQAIIPGNYFGCTS